MEAIFGIIGVFVAIAVFNLLVRGALGTVAAAGRAAVGKGSFTENMELQFRGMQPFAIRATLLRAGTEGVPFDLFKIEGRGLIPTSRKRNIRFMTSVIDATEGEKRAVWAMVEDFQEPETIAYQHQVRAGTVGPDQGLISWVRIGVVIPEMLVPPSRLLKKPTSKGAGLREMGLGRRDCRRFADRRRVSA